MGTIRTVAEVDAGETLPPRTIHVERATLVQYAGASLDRNRIHWDERFATYVGLPDVIAHGMFTMGSAVTVVTDWLGRRRAGAGVRHPLHQAGRRPLGGRRRHRGRAASSRASTPRRGAPRSS